MKFVITLFILFISQASFAATGEMLTLLNRFRIDNCSIVNRDIQNLPIQKGDIVKIINSKLGFFEVSRTLTSTAEIESFCRQNNNIDPIGWLDGNDFKKWPEVVLKQSENELTEKCFIIDGPANIREAPNSKIVRSLEDYEVSKVIKAEGDWLLISEPIEPLFDNYYFPLRCFTSTKLKPIGWTHKSNLKFFPTPLIEKTNRAVKLLNNEKMVLDSLSKHEMGMGKLSINFFKNSKVKSDYLGGLVIHRGDMFPSDAYLFNESHIVRIEYNGDYIKVTTEGFVVKERGRQSSDGSCEVVTTLIHPNKKTEVIKKEIMDARTCGAG